MDIKGWRVINRAVPGVCGSVGRKAGRWARAAAREAHWGQKTARRTEEWWRRTILRREKKTIDREQSGGGKELTFK